MTKIKEVSEQEIGIFIDNGASAKRKHPVSAYWLKYARNAM